MSSRKTLVSVTLIVLIFSLIPVTGHPQDRLLILAPDEFVGELQPLKRFKELTGRAPLILSLSQIYSNPQFNGVDEPEKIKKCIAYHAQYSGVKHVVLVGDVDKFPVRWRWWGRWMPSDPYFRGTWSIISGKYRQSNASGEFYSRVFVGAYLQYTVEVDVTRLSGDQARVVFADAGRQFSSFRVELSNNSLTLVLCGQPFQVSYTFSYNTSHKLTIVLGASNIQVYVDNSLQIDQPRPSINSGVIGEIGVGTLNGSAEFDNFKITSSSGTTLWDENFDDGVADWFEPPDMEERGWAVSDLYYADLFKQGTYNFDNWNSNTAGYHGDVYGEIEFKLVPDLCPACTINNDNIDYLPDVTVGRIPASTGTEVTRYVNKVIAYELGTSPDDAWFKKAFLYEGQTGGGTQNNNIEAYLEAGPYQFIVDNRHWSGDLGNLTPVDRKAVVVQNFNSGAGLVNYLGHGNFDEWSCMNFNSNDVATLSNSGKLPVVLAGACFTGRFAKLPPGDAYTDIHNTEHVGYSGCEPFQGTSASPSPIQVNHDVPCIAEDFLFNAGNPPGTAGAIAYLGERSAGRDWANTLSEYFFKSYATGTTIGEMWKAMIEDYYWANNLNQSSTWNYPPAAWETGHMFDEPQKFILFGDPSVQVGGAYGTGLCGIIWGAMPSYSRYRVTCDVTISPGHNLTAYPFSSLLFQHGTKLVTLYSGTGDGLVVDATSGNPVTLFGVPTEPPGRHIPPWVVIEGQLRVRQGGTIKFR
jgi:hypothetical protein